jgi:predicted XRE-type DNA-binding protein
MLNHFTVILQKERINMAKLPAHHVSSGNIFADLGLENADELLLKAKIAAEISEITKRRKLTQSKAATLMGVAQPDLSNLMRGHFKGFSIERLMKMITALGRDVEIIIRPAPRSRKLGKIKIERAVA